MGFLCVQMCLSLSVYGFLFEFLFLLTISLMMAVMSGSLWLKKKEERDGRSCWWRGFFCRMEMALDLAVADAPRSAAAWPWTAAG